MINEEKVILMTHASLYENGEGKKQMVFSLKNKEFNRMNGLLQRNPAAVSKMHEQAFSKLKELTRRDESKEA